MHKNLVADDMDVIENDSISDKNSSVISFRLANDRITSLNPCEHPELYTPGQDLGDETGLLR